MSIRNFDEWEVHAPRKAARLHDVLATTSTAARVDPDVLMTVQNSDGSVVVARYNGKPMGYFSIVENTRHSAMKLVVRRLTPKEADLSSNDVVLVQVIGPSGMIGPELRATGDKLTVFDFTGRELDARQAATGFGEPVDTSVVAFVTAAIRMFREREA
jgi:hypothetical protein